MITDDRRRKGRDGRHRDVAVEYNLTVQRHRIEDIGLYQNTEGATHGASFHSQRF